MDVGRQFKGDRRGARIAGSNNLETAFPDKALTTTMPHDHYNQRRGYDKTAVRDMLSKPPGQVETVEIDPRTVRVSQPGVTRAGVEYYSSPEYATTGRTFADQDNPGNRAPVVYDREDGSERILLSGHHRMMAALIKGEPLRARRVQGP